MYTPDMSIHPWRGCSNTHPETVAHQDDPLLLSKALGLVPPSSCPSHVAACGGVIHERGGVKNEHVWIPLVIAVPLVKVILQLFIRICLP